MELVVDKIPNIVYSLAPLACFLLLAYFSHVSTLIMISYINLEAEFERLSISYIKNMASNPDMNVFNAISLTFLSVEKVDIDVLPEWKMY